MAETDALEPSSSSSSRKEKCREILHKTFTWSVFKPILYGQALSLLICGTAVTSTYLTEDFNAQIPFFQSFSNYFSLALVYGILLALKKTESGQNMYLHIIGQHWWQYLIIATVDVAANGLIVTAYQYTTLTSVQVLDCFVIFVVMLLSWFFLKVRFLWMHYLGVAISLVGVAAMVMADWLLKKNDDENNQNTNSAPNPLLGDFLVIAASVCYGVSNVAMEYFIKEQKHSLFEIPAMYGLFGAVGSGMMVLILERDAIPAVLWNGKSAALFLGFTTCMFLLYTFMPRVMLISSATTVNISILTADLYALFVGVVLFSYKFSPLYIVSLLVIVLSLVIYNSKRPVPRQPPNNESAESETPMSSFSSREMSTTQLTDQKQASNVFTNSVEP